VHTTHLVSIGRREIVVERIKREGRIFFGCPEKIKEDLSFLDP